MTMTDAERIAALEHDNNRLREAYNHATNSQLTREDLKTMTPAQISTARRAGRLKNLLTGSTGS